MKNILLYLFLICVLFTACTTNPNHTDTSNATKIPTSLPNYNTVLNKQYLTEFSEDNAICVEIPIFTGPNKELLEQECICFVLDRLKLLTDWSFSLSLTESKPDMTDLSYTGYLISLNVTIAQLTNCNQQSLIFEGILNSKSSAHPTDLFFVLNLDVETGKRIWFKDKYVIDRFLYESFAAAAEESIISAVGKWPEHWGSFQDEICEAESFICGLDYETDYSWYPVDDGIIISYPVPFTLGSYMKVKMLFSQLKSHN